MTEGMGIGPIEIVSMALIGSGVIFFAGAVVGILRFPDYYTRIHAAGKGDTLSTLLIALGFAVYNLGDLSFHYILTSIKILMIGVFIFITGPTTTHVLMEAGYALGFKHWKKDGDEEEAER